MKTTQNKRKYSQYLRTLALSPLLIAMYPAYAQEQANQDDDVEVIEVTGFKGSLQKALNIKRTADNITDAISAEDIGKSTDANIAEALQRVTGISISREDGEGTTVTARGVPSSLNNVTLNGVPLTGSGTDQGVNFSEFSADILNNIEVQKTPSASTDEGSLGATIKLSGFKPLDAKKDRRNIDIQGRRNTFADTDDFRIQGAISEKFLDETVGLSIIATREESGTRRDDINYNRYRTVRHPNGATNVETGEVVTEWDYDGDGVLEPLELRQADSVNFQTQSVQRNRDSVAVTLQFIPWEGGEFQLDTTYTKQLIERDNRFISNLSERNNINPFDVVFDPNTFTVLRNVRTSMTDEQIADLSARLGQTVPRNNAARNVGVIRNQRQVDHNEQVTKVFGLQFDQDFDEVQLSMKGGRSETESIPVFNLRGFFRGRNGNPFKGLGVQNGFDCLDGNGAFGGGNLTCSPIVGPAGYIDDPSNFEFQVYQNSGAFTTDVATNLFTDLVWEKEISIFTSFETGFKISNREKETNSLFETCNRGCVGGELNPFTLADFTSGSTSGNVATELGFPASDFTDGFPIWDIETSLSFLEEIGAADRITQNLQFNDQRYTKIEQDIFAAYLQGNFEMLEGRLTGDIGIRYAKTDTEGTATTSFRFDAVQDFQTEENLRVFGTAEAIAAELGPLVERDSASIFNTAGYDYDNWLPSLNLNYALSEDKILRFAVSQTIARPRFGLLAPRFNISENLFGEFSFGGLGNVALNPFKSTNLDLSYEWYFDKSSLFSVALFDKEFSDFEERTSNTFFWRDVRSDFFDVASINDPTVDRAGALGVDQLDPNLDVSGAAILLPIEGGDNQPGCMVNRELDLEAPDATQTCDIVNISTQRNGSGGYVRGIELALQHNLDYLPGFWSGFGGVINYTYSDSRVDEETVLNPDGTLASFIPAAPLTNTSEHTLNATLFWEKDGKLIRLAYNYRTDYIINRTVNDFGAHWVEGFDTLDLSANWKINDTVSLNFQAVNLLDTVTREYATTQPSQTSNLPAESTTLGDQPTHRTVRLRNTGTIYRLGLRLTF